MKTLPSTDRRHHPGHAWHRQPVVWLGLALFLGSLAGCVWMIVVAAQYDDAPVATQSPAVFGVPVAAATTAVP
jgi:hypothetical protein